MQCWQDGGGQYVNIRNKNCVVTSDFTYKYSFIYNLRIISFFNKCKLLILPT